MTGRRGAGRRVTAVSEVVRCPSTPNVMWGEGENGENGRHGCHWDRGVGMGRAHLCGKGAGRGAGEQFLAAIWGGSF